MNDNLEIAERLRRMSSYQGKSPAVGAATAPHRAPAHS